MEDEKLLLAEYEFFTDSFWKNEELGEKRVDFFITLTTAIIAGIVALITSGQTKFSDSGVRQMATGALLGALLFGFITFLRILQRNRVTDEYKRIADYLREQLRRRSLSLSEYELPFISHKRLLRGGLAEMIAMMNSIIIAVISALWFGKGWGWVVVPFIFLILFILQLAVANNERQKKEFRAQTFRAGVGAIIINKSGKVLGLERRDIPGSWQLPQGGLEVGEAPLEAVKREIFEETGIKESKLILLSSEPRLLAYELPKEYRSLKTGRGQVQNWFLFRYVGLDEEVTLGDKKEFSDWKWLAMNDLVAIVVPFKRSVYKELAEYLSYQLQSSTKNATKSLRSRRS